MQSSVGRFVLIAALLAIVAAGCDGGSADTTSGPTTTSGPVATTPPGVNGLVFADATDAAGVTFTYATPFSEENYTPQMDTAKMRGGAAAGDFNNDGAIDIFVIGGGIEADALFINNGDGTFRNIAEEAGVRGALHLGSGATVGDYNNDGYLDLFVTSLGPPNNQQPGMHRLFRNNGDLTFTDVAQEAGVNLTSKEVADGFGSVFGDYDLDGDLDLVVTGWVRDSLGNRLFRNDGDGTFTDVTEEAGIVDNGIRGFSPCLADTDGDRYPELMIVADFGTSEYFVNNTDGTFSLLTERSGAGQEWSGMGTAMGDVNNDGMIDWYATAIYDDSGNGRGDGNQLYINLGDHQWEQVASQAGVDDGGWGWGAVTVDLNLDGWLDIVEVNGWHFPDFEVYTGERGKVFLSNGDGTFDEVAEATGFDHRLMGLAMINLDYDNDGDQDLAVTSANEEEFRLYRNDFSEDMNWLRVFLDTGGTPGIAPNGIGARVWATVGDQTYMRYVGGCANYLSHAEMSAHFGLGAASVVDELRVEWPDGSETVLTDVAPNQTLTVSP